MIRFQSQLPLRSPLFTFGLLVILSMLSILAASNAKSEGVANKAKNVARMNCGAQIECVAPDGRVTRVTPLTAQDSETAALVRDDDTVSCSLQEGETEFVISLPRTSLLDRLTFLNENAAAAGELTISVSNYRLPANSGKWKRVEGTIPFSNKRTFDLSLLGIEAKFVKLSFHVAKRGNIAAVGLYGEESLNDFAARQTHVMNASKTFASWGANDRFNFNFANIYAHARVVQVSSGSLEAAQAMIDDDSASSFRFAADDAHPTVVIELSGSQNLHRVGAVYEMQPAALKVYGLNNLLNDPAELDKMTPIASTAGEGKAAVEFNPQGARYIALRWKPMATSKREPSFSVAEINAFGYVSLASIDTDSGSQLMAQNDAGAKDWPGQSGPDFSNTLGTLANPPVVPVSP